MASAILSSTWFRLLGNLPDLLAPPSCGFCGAAPAAGMNAICASCLQKLVQERYPACRQCAAVLAAPVGRCGACLAKSDFPLCGTIGLFRYQGVGRELIRRLKRDHDGVIARSLAEAWRIQDRTLAANAWLERIEVVVCIPQRLQFPWESRNVGPGNLAQAIGSSLEAMVRPRLLRVRKWLRRQHELNVRQRQVNVRRAFRVHAPEDIKDRAVLVVDDVMTSGATLCSAAQTLLDVGAREVWGAVAARGQAFGAVSTKVAP